MGLKRLKPMPDVLAVLPAAFDVLVILPGSFLESRDDILNPLPL
jgi:hypothetical protein